MKKLFFTLSMALLCLAASAVPAKRGVWKTVKLANGTEVRVELRGDEFCKYWQAADGRKFVLNNTTGFYEKADFDAMQATAATMRAKAQSMREITNSRMNRIPIGSEHEPFIGQKKGLIVLVQFADVKFQDTNALELYKRIANEEGFSEGNFQGSVRDYFLDQSFGQFEFNFDVVGPVTLEHGYAYYGRNASNGGDDPQRMGEFVYNSCLAIDDQVNFADYDWDGDGEVDHMFFIYAGHGEASYSDPNTIWPHQFWLLSAMGEMPVLDGVRLNTYACSCELGSGSSIDGIGTICHEFSHCFGLPDVYDTSGKDNFGMESYDLMDSGSYNNSSFTPCGYTSYERWYVGWITPTELNEDTQINNMTALSQSGEAYIIYNEGNRNEYYLLENRVRTGWDEYIPASGLLILHVDFNANVWLANAVNATTGRERLTIFHADNTAGFTNTSLAGDVYPYRDNNSLTSTSRPAATVYNMNSDGSYYMNKTVTEITRNDDNTISFTFTNLLNNIVDDYTVPDSYIFYESFDQCEGVGGNDGVFSGSTVGGASLVCDNEGWNSTSSRGADQCALFGSQTMTGQATTPTITLDGEYELWFKAAPYTGSGTSLLVSVYEGDATLDETEFVLLQNRWGVYHTKLTGNGDVRLRFRIVSSGRFFLDKVCVTDEDVSAGISNVTVETPGTTDGRIYSIDGRYLGKDFNALKKGVYVVNGKKIVK